MSAPHADYYERRARQHRLFVRSTTCPEVSRCHARLARVYGNVSAFVRRHGALKHGA